MIKTKLKNTVANAARFYSVFDHFKTLAPIFFNKLNILDKV